MPRTRFSNLGDATKFAAKKKRQGYTLATKKPIKTCTYEVVHSISRKKR